MKGLENLFDGDGLQALKSDRSAKFEKSKDQYVNRLIQMENQMNHLEEKYKDQMKINSELADKI